MLLCNIRANASVQTISARGTTPKDSVHIRMAAAYRERRADESTGVDVAISEKLERSSMLR